MYKWCSKRGNRYDLPERQEYSIVRKFLLSLKKIQIFSSFINNSCNATVMYLENMIIINYYPHFKIPSKNHQKICFYSNFQADSELN